MVLKMNINRETPEGRPNHCPVCGANLEIDPSSPSGETPCPHCGHLNWFTWEDRGDSQVVTLKGNLFDAATVGPLFDSLEPRPGQWVILDFAEAQYVASQVLGKLINLKKKVHLAQGKLRLQNLQPDLKEVFRICRLDQVFSIED